jgi:YHS domain-containing protein
MAKLSPEDRALAEKQKTCPVSGALLGTMDMPYKMTVKGKDVFLCCKGCEGEIEKDPDKYLAKLEE